MSEKLSSNRYKKGLVISGLVLTAAGITGMAYSINDGVPAGYSSTDPLQALSQHYGKKITMDDCTRQQNGQYTDYLCPDKSRGMTILTAIDSSQQSFPERHSQEIIFGSGFLIASGVIVASNGISFRRRDEEADV